MSPGQTERPAEAQPRGRELLQASDPTQVDPATWNAYGTLIASTPGNSGQLPTLTSIEIPVSTITPGGLTKLAFKTSTEGTVPQSNSCFGGGNPGLGAAISLPYLYLIP